MSSLLNCYFKAIEFLDAEGTEYSKQDVQALARMLVARKAESASKAEFAGIISEELKARLKDLNLRKKAAALITLSQREDMLTTVKSEVKGTDLIGRAKSAYIGGGVRAVPGGNRSPKDVKNTIRERLRTIWRTSLADLPFANLIHQKINEGQFGRAFYQELHAIQKGDTSVPSKSKEAHLIAKSFNSLQNDAFKRNFAYNPWMNRIDDYGHRGMHDPDLIQATSKEQWVKDAMATHGNKSFPELTTEAEIKARFENTYDRIVSRDYGSPFDDEKWEVNFQGPNIHRQMARQRSLIPNDWESQFEYAKKYGHQTVHDLAEDLINRSGRNIAIIDKFGPNPLQFHEGFKRRLGEIRGKKLTKGEEDIMDDAYRLATRNDFNVADSKIGKFTEGVENLAIMTKLGFSALRTLPDISTAALQIRGVNGKNVFENVAEVALEFIKNIPPKVQKQTIEDLELYLSAQHNFLSADMPAYNVGDNIVNKSLSKGAELMGKVNLLGYITKNARAASGTVLTKYMAKNAKYEFNKLPDYFKNNLSRYGIYDNEWNAIRLAVESTKAPNGKNTKFITAGKIEVLPDEVIENMIRKNIPIGSDQPKKIPQDMINRERYKLATNYSLVIHDITNIGSSTANVRQKSMLTQGTDINTPWGSFLRIATQFKSASLATFEGFQRGLLSNKVSGADWSGVAQAAVASMTLWYFQKVVADFLVGKSPEQPNLELAAQAFLASGSLGPVGDLYNSQLMSDNSMSKTQATSRFILGPTIPDALALGVTGVAQLSESATQDKKLPLNDLWKIGRRNIPFQNLWLTKGVMDYYIFNEISESLNSGFIYNLQKKMDEKGQKQLFFNP